MPLSLAAHEAPDPDHVPLRRADRAGAEASAVGTVPTDDGARGRRAAAGWAGAIGDALQRRDIELGSEPREHQLYRRGGQDVLGDGVVGDLVEDDGAHHRPAIGRRRARDNFQGQSGGGREVLGGELFQQAVESLVRRLVQLHEGGRDRRHDIVMRQLELLIRRQSGRRHGGLDAMLRARDLR